eukprot:3395810-Rhodomonas_salina.1
MTALIRKRAEGKERWQVAGGEAGCGEVCTLPPVATRILGGVQSPATFNSFITLDAADNFEERGTTLTQKRPSLTRCVPETDRGDLVVQYCAKSSQYICTPGLAAASDGGGYIKFEGLGNKRREL